MPCCITEIPVPAEIEWNSKSTPVFCLNTPVPVPTLDTVFASPVELSGATPGSHLLVVEFHINTSLFVGAFAYSTSARSLAFLDPKFVSTRASVYYLFVLPSITLSVLIVPPTV